MFGKCACRAICARTGSGDPSGNIVSKGEQSARNCHLTFLSGNGIYDEVTMRMRSIVPGGILSVLLVQALDGQVASAVLFGEVRDESGAVVPAAEVMTRHQATGFSQSVQSGGDGTYRIDQLIPGKYNVIARKSGFRTLTAQSVELEINQKARLDLKLQVGAERDSVTVSAVISPLQANDSSVGYRLDYPTVRNLPLDGRNIVSLVTLGPGAIPRHLGGFTHDVANDVQENRGAVALNPPINGSRSTTNVFLLDGALNTDSNTRAIAVIPPMEAVQEFRIQSSLASAEFAQAGGGVVDVVTKAGGLNVHGSAFEYFRNEATDARNFFDDPALPRPIFRQNQFGGSIGGPLRRTSSFFFATYEGSRGKSAKSSLNIVPDQALRAGDFRARNQIFDPLNFGPDGARRPFSNNVVPAARIDPIASRYLERFQPLPNRQGTSNYLDATPNENTGDHVSVRLDRQFHSNSRFFGRYTLNDERNRLAGIFPELPTSERVRAQQVALGHTFSPGLWLNETRLAFTRLTVLELPENAFRTDVARELGIRDTSSDPLNFGLPFFLVTNFSMVLDTPTRPQVQHDNLWHLSDGVSLTRGGHTWRFGGEWTYFQMNYLQSRLSRGQYIFTGAFSANPVSPEATGDAFADFLLGFPQFTNRNVGSAQAYLRQRSYAAFMQDEWRLNSRFSLTLGLRYEYVAPFREARNNLWNLDYSGLPAAPKLVRVDTGNRPDRNNFAPRLGLAWRLRSRREIVFRAGYGFYFSPEIAVETYDLVRNGIRNESNATDGVRPVLSLRDGFPQTATTGFPSYFGLDPGVRTPYMQQWTTSIQHELPAGIIAEIAYIGSKGTKLGRFRAFNTPLRIETGENLGPRPGDLQALRPFPELGRIIQRQHISNSSYHSLQIKGEKRYTRNLAFLGSFVWSKSIDDSDSVIPGLFDSIGAQDERNLRLERGLSFFHVGRRFSVAVVYDLPARDFMRPLLANWKLSGIVTLQDGTPLNPVYFAYDGANSGTPNRPDIVPGQTIKLPRDQRSADQFFNTEAFQTPRPFTFGNAGRNILPGPGNAVLDLAVHRRFAIRESRAVELRTEFFNLLNHPNFGIPGPYPDFGPFFGKIFSTGQPRRLQLALRFDF
jgi:outer membrane receptor protein involved in Fe transport